MMSANDNLGVSQTVSPRADADSLDVLDAGRRCVACGYSLIGLGHEPRCPECGLRNIPEAYRQQMWTFVDSRRWFYSAMFRPFAKRPPGWWWALDREGDLKRSFRIAGRNLAVAALVIVVSAIVGGGVLLERTRTDSYIDSAGKNHPIWEYVATMGLLGLEHESTGRSLDSDWRNVPTGSTRTWSYSTRVIFAPSAPNATFMACLLTWVFVLWAGPSLVGVWTQIRKGLPDHARAPRTIIAACNLETHRAIYVGIFFCACVILETVLRVRLYWTNRNAYWQCLALLGTGIVAFGLAGWVGPLRSDYTRQLIRSRWHAVRIVIMYAIMLPAIAGLSMYLFLFFLLPDAGYTILQ